MTACPDCDDVRMYGIGDQSALVSYEGPVYHYTSSAGLLGVVSSGMLRASEASSLNDLAEVELGWRAIKKWLAKQPKGPGVKYVRRDLKHSRSDPKHQVFILSGSVAGDDANQWRLYADGGRGYTIELDGSAPLGVVSQDAAEGEKAAKAYGNATEFVYLYPWHHVLYTKGALCVALEAVVAYADEELIRISAINDDEGQEHAAEVLGEEVSEELALIAHLYKSPGFVGEQEVRVVARFMWFGKHVGFRAGAYGIAGHIHLVGAARAGYSTRRVVPAPSMEGADKHGFVHPLPITMVRLGPLIHVSNRETVRAFLRASGLRSALVKRSKVPLR